jgi:hypothetical protein
MKYSVSRGIPAQNMQLPGIFQYKIFSQYGFSSIKYSAFRVTIVTAGTVTVVVTVITVIITAAVVVGVAVIVVTSILIS